MEYTGEVRRELEMSDEIQFDLINRIPVGIGIYKIEKGIPFLVFLNDSYYDLMGFKREDRVGYLGTKTILAVHPEDRDIIMEGIKTVLSGKVNQYRVEVRLLTNQEQGYHWIQMEGQVGRQEGAVTYLYVSFTKIDNLKKYQEDLSRAKTELEKSRAWLQSAMDTAGIQYFEYFPKKHLAVGYHNHPNKYGIPRILHNYPDCLFEIHLAHPEDEASFREFWDTIQKGGSPVTWDGRFTIGHDKYKWFRVIVTKVEDTGEEPVFSCTMMDMTIQKEAEESYHNHLDAIMRSNPDAIASFRLNATKNLCYNGASRYMNIENLKNSGTVDGFLQAAQALIPDEEGRKQVYDAFHRQAVLDAFERGQKHIEVEHRFCLEENHVEWIKTIVDLMRHPVTGDVEGILYTLNTNTHRMERTVLTNILERWYDAISVVDMDTGEYFIFEKRTGSHGKHGRHFFDEHNAIVRSYISAEEWEQFAPQICAETMKERMEKQGNYYVNFFCQTPDGLRRKQLNYYYTDHTRHTMIASLRDFSDMDLLERFRHSSEHDPVTDLYNRQKTFAECRRMLDEHPDESFYICHMDIRRFHLINSFYGEAVGDTLLYEIGQQFERCAHNFSYAVYGRIEADVFCLCVPKRKDVLEREARMVNEWLKTYRNDFLVESNFGVYEITNRELAIEAMFTRATIAAKESRKSLVNRYNYYDSVMERELQVEQQITNDMHAALAKEQFQVYLQPKYDLKSSEACGAEALVRWEHPTKGMISPGDFIPLFEKNGFILNLDQYMWEHVCLLLRGWIDAGRNPEPVSVNVSRVSMYSPTTVSFLHELVEKYRLPHELLQLELTESAYMDDPEEMKRRLKQLQDDGFVILMDDFGSGYSSLNTLRELPVDYLKIDVCFLMTTEDNQRSRLILASVVHMARCLNLPVIIEGVETEEQKQFSTSIGCDYAQGFLFTRPMPVKQYETEILYR